jgi:hypothetical protein
LSVEKLAKRKGRQSAMLLRYERIECKAQLLERLDPKHEAELDTTFAERLAAAIRAEDPKERHQETAEAIEAYEDALDDALYEILGNHFAEEDSSVA